MKNILVIDDEDFIIGIVEQYLTKEGFNVFSAADLKTAKGIIAKQKLDLIITDIMVPYLGGFELVEELKENPGTKHIPVIIITGMDKEIFDTTPTSAEEKMRKPFTLRDLREKVKKYVG